MSMKAMLFTGVICGAIMVGGACALDAAKDAWTAASEPMDRITYVYEMESGDTVYQVAAKVATPKENINRLSWQICHDNNITDPAAVQPGTVLTIHVDPASEVLHGDR